MQPNTSSLDSLGGHSAHSAATADPYETKYDTSNASPYNQFWSPNISNENSSVTLQVKASVSPPGGSPISSTPSALQSALPSAVSAANSHPMSHQSYPTYHYHNPYHPASMDLAYFGGQNYNMANSAAMFRPDAYDAYQQAASQASEGRYQLL